MKNILKPLTFFILVIFLTVILDIWLWFHPYILPKENFLFADGIGFYMYLPSTFIYHDWNMNFFAPHGSFCISDTGDIVLRNSMGVSVLLFPFFIIAHILTLFFNSGEADGFSFFYQIFIAIASLFYFGVGLFFTYKTLKIKFQEKISLLSILAITLGCGTIFHTTIGASYSHIYSFCAIAFFIWLICQEEKHKDNIFYYFIMGIVFALIILLRNANVFVGLFLLFYNKTNFKRLLSLDKIIPFSIGFLIMVFPQMLYWKMQTGNFIVNTYSFQHVLCQFNPQSCYKEHIDWLKPHIIGNWFSYRKGLFFYYPVMIFAFLGFIWLKKYFKEAYYSTIAFIVPSIYIICSWSEWWYGFSFGQRPYMDYMSIFAILIASTLTGLKEKKYYKISLILFFVLIIVSFVMMLMAMNNYCNEDGSIILHSFY